MRIALLTAALLLSGCHAEIMSRGGEGSKYAPANDKRSGTASYVSQGAAWVKKANREKAYKKMYDFCGGSYAIESEYPQQKNGSEYTYIDFECAQ